MVIHVFIRIHVFIYVLLQDGDGDEALAIQMIKHASAPSTSSPPKPPPLSSKPPKLRETNRDPSMGSSDNPLLLHDSSTDEEEEEEIELSKTKKKSRQTSTSSSSKKGDSEPLLHKKTRHDKVVVHWVSYLDGQQRVLLFTQDQRIASRAKQVRIIYGIITIVMP